MRKNKDILKVILITLIAIFLMIGVAALLLANHKKSIRKEQQKAAALEALESIPKATPTPAATPTPTPEPTATPTPTPAITRAPAFDPDDYWNVWYSTDGLAAVNIYDISLKSVSFSFSQASDEQGTHVSEADVTAEVAGNAAKFSFTDSWGNRVSGSMTFDQGRLYLRLSTTESAGGGVTPSVNCIMTRTKKATATAMPVPTVTPAGNTAGAARNGDYYFADSDSRYLTDEELSQYSSSDLELAKNEIYARHGRKFVTQRIADYFNSKPWYNGTVDAEAFDAQQDSVFNEYEVANIQKIAEMEQKKRSEGN